jgi:prevent-host-death family protein
VEKTVPLREANQAFARFVREVEAGAVYTITRNGTPVARLIPIDPQVRRLTPEMQAARNRTRVRTTSGWPIAAGPLDRDALHER